MTDTNKDFEKWALSDEGAYHESELRKLPKGEYALPATRIASESWQACQSLNDKRIADLLAVIERKDAAFRSISRYGQSKAEIDLMIDEALAITPESVELVEVGSMQNDVRTGHTYNVLFNQGMAQPIGTKLYTIKQKG